jgi:hypothetical protein
MRRAGNGLSHHYSRAAIFTPDIFLNILKANEKTQFHAIAIPDRHRLDVISCKQNKNTRRK